MQQARAEQFADHVAEAAGGVEMVHIGDAVRIDARHQRRDRGNLGHVAPVEDDASRARHGHQVDQ